MPAGGRRVAAAAVGIHFGMRLLMIAAVMIGVAVHSPGTGSFGGHLGAALGKSDGVWYLGIAHHGYGPQPRPGPDGTYPLTPLAFFPLYPMLVRAVAFVGLPYLGAALVVTLLLGTLAAVAIAMWGRILLGSSGALMLLGAWELLPSSVVLSMVYSEALFAAAAAGCLLALRQQRWLVAGSAAAIGCLTRPTGGCLILAISVAGWEGFRQPTDPGQRQALLRRVGAALLISIAGLAVSLGHVSIRTHRLSGWFWVERTIWSSGFDAGRSTFDTTVRLVSTSLGWHRVPDTVSAIVMVLVVIAIARIITQRGRLGMTSAEVTYVVTVALLALGEHSYYYVKPRLLLVGFPLLVPLASWLRERPRSHLRLFAIAAVTVSVAYNCYLVAGWPRAL